MAAVALSPDEAHAAIPQDVRNAIYSALLSGDGIRNIEATLDHHLQTSGFKAALRAYVTELFRSGQATTAVEARDMAMARIKAHMQHPPQDSNGTSTDPLDPDLTIPPAAIKEGTKSVRAELEKVVDITYDNDK